PGFVQQISDMTGAAGAQVVKAAFLARDSFELPKLWGEIDALDGRIAGQTQNDLYALTTEVFIEATRLILQTQVGAGEMDGAMGRLKAAIKGMRSSMSRNVAMEAAARAA